MLPSASSAPDGCCLVKTKVSRVLPRYHQAEMRSHPQHPVLRMRVVLYAGVLGSMWKLLLILCTDNPCGFPEWRAKKRRSPKAVKWAGFARNQPPPAHPFSCIVADGCGPPWSTAMDHGGLPVREPMVFSDTQLDRPPRSIAGSERPVLCGRGVQRTSNIGSSTAATWVVCPRLCQATGAVAAVSIPSSALLCSVSNDGL